MRYKIVVIQNSGPDERLLLKPIQIFNQYDGARSDGLDKVKHCPDCGAPCTIKQVGEEHRRYCDVCEKPHFVNPASSVAILIVENDQFVLCRRIPNSFGGGKWCLPCGFIEFNEDFLTAGVRESKEETGLEIEVLSIISVTSNFLSPQSHTMAVVLLARQTGGTLVGGDDIDEARWHRLSDPLPPMAFDADRHIIERYASRPFEGAPVEYPESDR